MRKCICVIVSILVLASCSVTKYTPEGKKLYRGAGLEFIGKTSLAEQSKVEEAINLSIFPRPNRKLLGLVYFNLWVHYNFDESKDKWWSKFMYSRFAEEPVYLDEVNIRLIEQIVQKEMQDEGYFNSEVNGEIIEKKQTAKIRYSIDPTRPTIMTEIVRPQGETAVDSIVRNYRRKSVKEGERYRLEAFDIERSMFTEHVRSQGYFDFTNLDIYYLVDTVNIDSVKIIMKLKKPANDTLHRKYFIRNVNVYATNGALGSGSIDEAKTSYEWKGLTIYEDFRYIDKKTLASNVLINPGDVFSVKDYNLTLARLVNLNVFRYVNIQYEKSATDSLDVNILLTPTEYKDVVFNGEVNTSDRSFLGSSVSSTYNNNNAFRKAEKFSAALVGGVELQAIESDIQLSVLRLNASLRYEVPRLLVPFPTREFKSSVAPKTIMKVEDEYQLWLRYFTANSFNVLYGYEWQTESRYTFNYQPLFMNYLNVFSTTEAFDSISLVQPQLGLTYADNVSIGSQFTLSHTNKRSSGQRNSYYVRWNLETSGNTSTLFTKNITGIPIAQYVRTDVEYRFTRLFTLIENLVVRLNFGIVNAYGNSTVAPFTKQFFMGGPTTLRGFEFRSVGPGRYKANDDSGFTNPIDQSGDIRLLFNAEYRFPLFSIFRGALFSDAGNVWLLDEEAERPDGQFKFGEFYKELAWNSGLGLRADLDFIALRLDFGVPLYKPYKVPGERWIHETYGGGLFPWMRQNVVLSAGIGYPF